MAERLYLSTGKITEKVLGRRAALGERIRQLRGRRTQVAFAALLGMKQPQLARYEAGRQPDVQVLTKIAKTCGVTVDWLLTGEGPESRGIVREADGQSFLESIVEGTPIRLGRAVGAKVERAWRRSSDERKEEIRNYLRRAALIAIAVEQLLPHQSAKALIDAFSVQITQAVTAKIVASA